MTVVARNLWMNRELLITGGGDFVVLTGAERDGNARI